jgi:16S rRNA (guanine(966)-N(2))-methyltransferase RsmD
VARKQLSIRITGGSARGSVLRGPVSADLRPTSGRLRESLFGMIDAADVEMTEVVDLYAGTGALGIEALSRGAERCTFVESNAAACRAIDENLKRVRMAERAFVVRDRVGRWRPQDAIHADARRPTVRSRRELGRDQAQHRRRVDAGCLPHD